MDNSSYIEISSHKLLKACVKCIESIKKDREKYKERWFNKNRGTLYFTFSFLRWPMYIRYDMNDDAVLEKLWEEESWLDCNEKFFYGSAYSTQMSIAEILMKMAKHAMKNAKAVWISSYHYDYIVEYLDTEEEQK